LELANSTIVNLPEFPKLKYLTIVNSTIVRVPSYKNLITAYFEDCKGLEEIAECENLTRLTIKSCNKLVTLPNFPKLEKAYIKWCDRLEKLSDWPNVQYVAVIVSSSRVSQPVLACWPRLSNLELERYDESYVPPYYENLKVVGNNGREYDYKKMWRLRRNVALLFSSGIQREVVRLIFNYFK
jgi:hypothetical protein